MSNFIKTPNENSIKEWAQAVDKMDRNTPLGYEGSHSFCSLVLGETEFESDPEFMEYLESMFMTKLIIKRITAIHSYTITKAAITFLGTISKTPAQAVMLMNYLQYKTNELGINNVDMEFLSMGRLFGHGLFSDQDLDKAWDMQKISYGFTGNLLDHPEFGKTIGCKFSK